MTGKSKPTAEDEPLAAKDVAAYLKRHSEFLIEHPDVLAALHLPDAGEEGNVRDFQQAMIARLRERIARLERERDELVDTSRSNLVSQSQIHGAILALLRCNDFDSFLATVTDGLRLRLDMAAVVIAIEDSSAHPGAAARDGVIALPPGAIAQLLEPGEILRLREVAAPGNLALYGHLDTTVHSDALAFLDLGEGYPPALLAFGATERGHFHPGQATNLLAFLAESIALITRQWLFRAGI